MRNKIILEIIEEAIKKYNEALELSKKCYETLKKAELVVKVDE